MPVWARFHHEPTAPLPRDQRRVYDAALAVLGMSEVHVSLRQQITRLTAGVLCYVCGISGGGHRIGCAGSWGTAAGKVFMTGVGWVDWQSWPR